MKAFLLAAGEGRRLLPLTRSTPKCLVPINGTPLLQIWFRLLEREGVDAVLVNVHHLRDKVQSFVGSCETKLHVVTVYEETLLGSAGTVTSYRDFVDAEEDFLILYADNLANVSLKDLVSFHRSTGASLTLGVTPTERPREKGIVVTDDRGRVLEFQEKPDEPRSNLANAGIYVATPKLFDFLPSSPGFETPLDFGFDVLPRMIGSLYAFRLDGFLLDIGTPSAYARAQAEWPGFD